MIGSEDIIVVNLRVIPWPKCARLESTPNTQIKTITSMMFKPIKAEWNIPLFVSWTSPFSFKAIGFYFAFLVKF